MARIGTFELPPNTLVDEKTELVLGRVRKLLSLTFVLDRFSDRNDYLSAVSDLLAQIERLDRGETDLSVHAGRFFRGRRRKWNLVRQDSLCLAVVSLEFLAEDRFERGETENTQTFSITLSPQSFTLSPGGNWNALPSLKLTASSSLTDPVFSDGVRTLTLDTDLSAGDTVVADSENRTVIKNGSENLLGKSSGEFPELAPGSTTLTYSDSTSSTPSATLEVIWRDRWV